VKYLEIEAKEEHLLTCWERDALEQHTRMIESDVMEKFDIIVFTVSSLVDVRASHFAKHHPISTLVVDEAGQMTQPANILVAQLEPKRVIVIGDHFQLQPSVTSYAAEIAGLKMSQMEWTSRFK
jgi:ATP-dependent RNA/DNA helicase IGHMBP2